MSKGNSSTTRWDPLARLVIFHYHLKPGGVTSVIVLGIQALLAAVPEIRRLTLVSGSEDNLPKIKHDLEESAKKGGVELEVCLEPDTGYLNAREFSGRSETETRAGKLADTLIKKYGNAVWWVHNYHLGKNPVFTQALLQIARERPDQPLLLQIHDFPESGRFENLKHLNEQVSLPLYPRGNRIQYLTINGRDREILMKAGIPADSVTYLPNPVDTSRTLPKLSPREKNRIRKKLGYKWGRLYPGYKPEAPLAFYPVRTIRRKNILEAGLIARLSFSRINLLVTLPGVSAQEEPYSSLVENLFRTGVLPGIWGSGVLPGTTEFPFEELASVCDLLISSSVQEGFGYLFINAAVWKKPLFTRRIDVLDEILPVLDGIPRGLYSSLTVPMDKNYRSRLTQAYEKRLLEISRLMGAGAGENLREWLRTLTGEDKVDFSYLPVHLQTEVLDRTEKDSAYGDEIRRMNRETFNQLESVINTSAVSADSAEPADSLPDISENFGMDKFGQNVRKLLLRLTSPDKTDIIDSNSRIPGNGGAVVQAFSRPEYQRLLLQPFNGGGD